MTVGNALARHGLAVCAEVERAQRGNACCSCLTRSARRVRTPFSSSRGGCLSCWTSQVSRALYSSYCSPGCRCTGSDGVAGWLQNAVSSLWNTFVGRVCSVTWQKYLHARHSQHAASCGILMHHHSIQEQPAFWASLCSEHSCATAAQAIPSWPCSQVLQTSEWPCRRQESDAVVLHAAGQSGFVLKVNAAVAERHELPASCSSHVHYSLVAHCGLSVLSIQAAT